MRIAIVTSGSTGDVLPCLVYRAWDASPRSSRTQKVFEPPCELYARDSAIA